MALTPGDRPPIAADASPAPILSFPRAPQAPETHEPHPPTDADVLRAFAQLILAEFGHELRLHENGIIRMAAAARTGATRGRRKSAIDELTASVLGDVQFVRRFVDLMQETLPTLGGLSPDERTDLVALFCSFSPPTPAADRTGRPARAVGRSSANESSN